MKVVFDVDEPEPTEVEFEGETFVVFGHVQIIEPDEDTELW